MSDPGGPNNGHLSRQVRRAVERAGGVPDLGRPQPAQPKVITPPPESAASVYGSMVAVLIGGTPGDPQVFDAPRLLDAIRSIVREEIAAARDQGEAAP